MKIFSKMKDGGELSTVTGYWLIEIKSLFSIVLLRFDNKSREAYHTHAFNCINWLLRGRLWEYFHEMNRASKLHVPSWYPFAVKREDFHKVDSDGISWLLSIRGPWQDKWSEYLPQEQRQRTLTHGRTEV